MDGRASTRPSIKTKTIITMKIGIINPDNNTFTSVDQWKKDPEPKRANLIAIINNEANHLVFAKKYLPRKTTYGKVQSMIDRFGAKGADLKFRLPTRKECLDIYDASLTDEFKDALELLHGNLLQNTEIWTQDLIEDTEGVFNWTFNMLFGTLNFEGELFKAGILPVLCDCQETMIP
jgi:hypothetical protein